MKYSLIIAAVAAQTVSKEEEAALCKSVSDCDKNFDAIYSLWGDSEAPDKETWEPKVGEMACATMQVSGTDEDSGDAYDVEIKACTH